MLRKHLRNHPAMKKVRWCSKCRAMVSKWHEHFGKEDFIIIAMPQVVRK